MKTIRLVCFVFILVSIGCQTGGEISKEELVNWYESLKETDSRFLSPLYYQGSDEKYHYFICRSMDTWVSWKVQKSEIKLIEEIPEHTRVTSRAGQAKKPVRSNKNPLEN